ncbi:MAG: ATP-binding protein, partial [Candidatus Omnitrophota bacterium]
SLVLGIFMDTRLEAFIVMGPKVSGQLYMEDDLEVFSVLANQASLAIENARFYENVRHTQKLLFRAEKMATIGTMADGLSHQINNRFHVMGFIAGDMLDSLNMYEKDPEQSNLSQLLGEFRKGLIRVEENVCQGSQVVRGLLDYSRSDESAQKEGVDIHKLMKASIDMVSLKVHLKDFQRQMNIPSDVPRVMGNFVQLQEVFFNIIDNAYFSMMDKKSKKIEEAYKPGITFSSEVIGDMLKITVADNGLGIRPDDQKKLFTPFFTTKASSHKGNGLGLYVIRKIIEEGHAGTISICSQYLEGVTVEVLLPVMPTAV